MLGVSLLPKKHLVEGQKNHFYAQILRKIRQNDTHIYSHFWTCMAQKSP